MTEVRVVVRSEGDAADASRAAREAALAAGLGASRAVEVATAVSELAINQVRYAGGGEIRMRSGPAGLEIEARDEGPGIPDVTLALRDGWSSSAGLGLGLPGARRLMDDFDLETRPGGGTVVRMAKRARTGDRA